MELLLIALFLSIIILIIIVKLEKINKNRHIKELNDFWNAKIPTDGKLIIPSEGDIIVEFRDKGSLVRIFKTTNGKFGRFEFYPMITDKSYFNVEIISNETAKKITLEFDIEAYRKSFGEPEII